MSKTVRLFVKCSKEEHHFAKTLATKTGEKKVSVLIRRLLIEEGQRLGLPLPKERIDSAGGYRGGTIEEAKPAVKTRNIRYGR